MKKILKMLTLCIVAFTIASCSANSLGKIQEKEFNGVKGGSLVIDKKADLLYFSGPGRITPYTDTSNIDEKEYEKGKNKEYKSPKVVEENGKKMLKAVDFPYKLEVVNENLIVDLENGNEYIFVDLSK